MEDKNVVIKTLVGGLTSVINSLSEKNNDSATATEVNPPESDKTELETNSPEVHSDTNDSNLEEAKKILNIQPRNFDENKKNLQETIKSIDKSEINIGLSKYKLAFFGLKNRKDNDKVTVSDINGLTNEIQGEFKKVQERELQMLKEFQTVFNTFDSLDKEYISAILTNVAAIKKTNDDLNLTIEKQGQAISKLVSFKEKINDLASESQKHEEQLSSLINFKEQLEEIKEDSSDLNEDKIKLALLNYQNEIEKNQQESFNKMSSSMEKNLKRKLSENIKKAYFLAVISIIFAFFTFFFSIFNVDKNNVANSVNPQEITSIANFDINNPIEDSTSQLLPTESQPIQNSTK